MLASANCSCCQKRRELPKIAVAGRERNLALAHHWWSNVKPMFYSHFGKIESWFVTVLCAHWGAPGAPKIGDKGLGTQVGGGITQTQTRLGWRQLGDAAKDASGPSMPPGMQEKCSHSCSRHAPAARDVPTVPAGGGPGHVISHRLEAPACPCTWAAGCLLAPWGSYCRSQPLWLSPWKSSSPCCLCPLPPAC